MPKKLTLFVVSHFHWDREWFWSFEQYRIRLVKAMDHLLSVLDTVPDFKSFTLDGQTIVLDDYLEIRPDAKEKIRRYVKEGRILIGPMYSGSDDFLPSSESIVRNFLLGRIQGEEFGGIMSVGYFADVGGGHLAQMPQILRGFGIDSLFVGRGLTVGAKVPEEADVYQSRFKSEFIWEAPDGSSVLAVHMPAYIIDSQGRRRILHYCNAMELPSDLEKLLPRLEMLKKALVPIAATSNILLMNGCDRVKAQPELPETIRRANEKLEGSELMQGSIPEYIKRVRAEAKDLPVRRGESFQRIGAGTSSHIYLKQRNAHVQMLVERWVEPFSVFAWTLGNPYPKELIWQAWKYLLQNHAHDSIWGTCIDTVNEEMMCRFKRAEEIAEDVAGESLQYIAERVNTKGRFNLVLFNPLSWPVTAVVTTKINLSEDMSVSYLLVEDVKGETVPSQVHAQRKTRRCTARYWREPDGIVEFSNVNEVEFSFLAENVPPCGYRAYSVEPTDTEPSLHTSLVADKDTLENEFVKVAVNANGTLNVEDKTTGALYRDLNLFEDSGDAGSGWYYRRPKEDAVFTSRDVKAHISLVESGPVRGTLKIDFSMMLPISLSEDVTARSRELTTCDLTTYVRVYPKVSRIDILTDFNNMAEDHRLRVVFPTKVQSKYYYAEGHYQILERDVRPQPEPEAFRSFVDVNDGSRGMAIITKGLHECEVYDDGGLVLTLTLLRAVLGHRGELEPDLTRGAQCLGIRSFEYALLLHKGNWKFALVHRQTQEYNVPLRTAQTGGHVGSLPSEMSFLSIKPEDLAPSAIKKAEEGDAMIIRFYNVNNDEVNGRIKLYKPSKEAAFTNLNEEKLPVPLAMDEEGCSMKVGGAKIVTIRLALSDVGVDALHYYELK